MENSVFPVGPIPDVSYPLKVNYCGNCSMPIEYCEFYPEYEKCKEWLQQNMPDEFIKLKLDQENDIGEGDEKKRQKRGGKGGFKPKKKQEVIRCIKLALASRGKKKSVTIVTGLKTFDIDLKEASKFFSSRFSCGSSVTGDDEIVVQGDVKDDIGDVIVERWPQVNLDLIEDLGEQKR